ncbi:MAG: leucine-rich repeat protein [Bacteroidales bacterium]|jgi:hypothetical protein|nr:leucine-rich repeat protein [Bacteroidales bacterium]
MKKILIILLFAFLCLNVENIKSQTIISSGTCGTLTWELNSDSLLTINGNGQMLDNSAPWLSYSNRIKDIVIGNGVITIGAYAFQNCSKLKTVQMGGSLISIHSGAFYYCSNLNTISFPNNLDTIDAYVFNGCTSLITISLPNNLKYIGSLAFAYCNQLISINIPQYIVSSIDYMMFYGCSQLTDINVHANNMRYSSENGILLTKAKDTLICCPAGKTGVLNLPTPVAVIKEYAFRECINLTSILLHNNVSSIGPCAFQNCSTLLSLNLPSTTTDFTTGALQGCVALQNINVDIANPKYSSIDGILYNKTRDTVIKCPEGKSGIITLPNFVTTIRDYAFQNCINIEEVILPSFLTTLQIGSFHSSGIQRINITNHVTKIEPYVFYNCNNLTSVTISNSVTSIESYAFMSSGLKSLTLPNSIDTIRDNAFAYTNLQFINIQKEVPPFVSYAPFTGISTNIPVYVPCNSVTSYQAATYWSNFTNYYGIQAFYNYSVTQCQDVPYTDANFTNGISQAGTYCKLFQNPIDCDSLVSLTLSFSKTDTVYYNAVTCQGVGYTDENFTTPISDTGVYHYVVLQNDNNCDSVVGVKLSYYSEITAPTNLFIMQISAYGLNVFWDAQGYPYSLYRNGDFLADIDTNFYYDTNLVMGQNYCYTVKTRNECDIESNFSEEACQMFMGISEVELENVNVYPNPAKDNLFIESSNNDFDEVRMFDISGRTVLNHSFNNTKKLCLNITNLSHGVYNLVIFSEGKPTGFKKILK